MGTQLLVDVTDRRLDDLKKYMGEETANATSKFCSKSVNFLQHKIMQLSLGDIELFEKTLETVYAVKM